MLKVPSFISESKLINPSLYNYKMEDDKKIEEIFPYSDQYTNSHENKKSLSITSNKTNTIVNFSHEKHSMKKEFNSIKSKGASNWIKNVKKNLDLM